MINNSLFLTILLVSSLNGTLLKAHPKYNAEVKKAHDDMSNEFSTQLLKILSDANDAFTGLEIAFPEYSLSWTHGSVPDLTLKFDLNSESIKVCRFDFQVNCFWEHLQETLEEESANSFPFRAQV